MEEMLSLYDYLGHAAGSSMGKQVAIAASRGKIKTESRYVSNPAYKGEVMLYPRQFLTEYFTGGNLNEGSGGKQLLKG